MKVISLYRAFFEEMGRKFVAWTDDTVQRSWSEIHSDHDDVRLLTGLQTSDVEGRLGSCFYWGDIILFAECHGQYYSHCCLV